MLISSVAEADQHAPLLLAEASGFGFEAIRLLATAFRKALSRNLTLAV
jgi:hypothetical protein